MSKIFVAAHGGHPLEQGETFVPAGWKVVFHADLDEKAFTANDLAAVLSGGSGGSWQTYDERASIPNYHLGPYDDADLARYLASRSSLTGGDLYFVGAPSSLSDPAGGIGSVGAAGSNLALCTNPEVCTASGRHATSYGKDACWGLFALLAWQKLDATEVHLLCCRHNSDDAPTTVALGSEKDRMYDVRVDESDFEFDSDDGRYLPTLDNKYLDWIDQLTTDPQPAMAEFGGMPQATQAPLAMLGADMSDAWDTAQWEEWPLSREDAPVSFPAAVWGDHGEVPASLEQGWDDAAWRHAFFFYLNGPARVDGLTKNRLTLWAHLRARFQDETSTILDATGAEHIIPPVAETEILAYAQLHPTHIAAHWDAFPDFLRGHWDQPTPNASSSEPT